MDNVKLKSYQSPFTYDSQKAVVIDTFLRERYYIKFRKKVLSSCDKKILNKNFVPMDVEYIETWSGLCRRTARCIASGIINLYKHCNKPIDDSVLDIIRSKESEFYFNMYNILFLPSSPFMMNALVTFFDNKLDNSDYTQEELEDISNRVRIVYSESISLDDYKMLANHKNGKCAFGSCYTMGSIADELYNNNDGIYDMLRYQGEIFRAAGGVGFNFSKLRSSKAIVKTIRGKSSGPVKFMQMFNEPTNVIAMTSSKKRGANMFILNVSHPDIKEFVNAKTDKEAGYKNLDKANISVGITDEFMNSLMARKNDESVEYPLRDPTYDSITESIDPLGLWDNIISNSVQHAEPGMIFLDNIQRTNSIPSEVKTCTNPCAEYIAADKTVCTLGSVNLMAMISNGEFYYGLLERTTKSLAEFLSISIFTNDYPLPFLKDRSMRFRPIGIGFMGYESANIILDNKNIKLRDIFTTMLKSALEISNEYAKQYSKFDDFDNSKFAKGLWVNDKPLTNFVSKETAKSIEKDGLFNAYFFAIAPTGSISFIADVSSGIEPIFSLKTTRIINKGNPNEYSVTIYDQAVLKFYAKQLFQKDEINHDEMRIVKEYIDKLPKNDTTIRTALKMSPVEHLLPLIEIADIIDMNTSKTINLSRDNLQEYASSSSMSKIVITERPTITLSKIYPDKKAVLDLAPIIDTNLLSAKQIISDIYYTAWVFGIKGLTTYTEGSRSPVLVDSSKEEETITPATLNHSPLRYYKICAKLKLENGGRIYIDLGVDQDRNPFKLLIKESKEVRKSNDTKYFIVINNLIGRAISTSLKSNIPMDYILKQLEKTEEYDNVSDKYIYSPYVCLIITTIRELIEIAQSNNTFAKAAQMSELENKYTLTAKGYLINSEGKKVCPVCKNELNTSAGCETCPSCGWGACA